MIQTHEKIVDCISKSLLTNEWGNFFNTGTTAAPRSDGLVLGTVVESSMLELFHRDKNLAMWSDH